MQSVDSEVGAGVPQGNSGWRFRRAEALFEGIDDAVLVHDLEGNILDVNPAACHRLGYSREELLRLTTQDIDQPSSSRGFQAPPPEQLARGRFSYESCYLTKEGRLIPVDINASLIDLEGKLVVLAVVRDLTRRKTAEQRWGAQYAVTRVLAEAATLTEAGPRILQAVAEGLGWDLGALWVEDRQFEVLRCAAFWNSPARPSSQMESVTRNMTLAAEETLPGRVWASGERTWIAEVATDPHFNRREAAARDGIHSAGAFPILSGKTTIGALEFFSFDVNYPDNDQLVMMAAFGSQIGQFIERKQAEEERLRMAKNLRLLLESSGEGFFGIDREGRCTFINKAAADMVGYQPEEVLGQIIHPLIHHSWPDGSPYPITECPGFRVIAGGRSLRGENEMFWREDGSGFPAQYTCHPVVEGGQVIGAVTTFMDITERKKAEAELRKSNSLLDAIVENIPSMIFVKDAVQLRFERVNKALETILGYRREDLLGKNDYDFFPKDQADFFTAKDREVLGEDKQLALTEEVKTRKGLRMFHTRKLPIVIEEGKPQYLLGISEDITELKALEKTRQQYAEARECYAKDLEAKNQALVESERRYRQLTEASLDAIVVADPQGRVTLFNPAAERVFGYPAGEIVGQPLLKLLPDEEKAAGQVGFRSYVETRQPPILGRAVELQGRRKDGTEFPLEASLSAVDMGGETRFLGAVRDLTERNRMRAMVVQTEKLASIGLLSAGVAHEINNPLAYVANNLVVLERDVRGMMTLLDIYEGARACLAEADPDTARKALQVAEEVDLPYIRDNLDRILTKTREGVQRVSKIVQSLRGLARTDRPQMEEVAVPDLVDNSLEMIRGRLKRRGIQVEMDYGPAPKVHGSFSQLGQVLLNLLVNALQAIEAGNPAAGGRIRLATRRVGEELLIEVCDNGCGMDPRDVSRIFDPFYTTKPVGEGTGLGLSISHGIVAAHGGRIEVESRPGEGARFAVYLPLNHHRGSP